jgi:uncharacterized ferredoxin-like protein
MCHAIEHVPNIVHVSEIDQGASHFSRCARRVRYRKASEVLSEKRNGTNGTKCGLSSAEHCNGEDSIQSSEKIDRNSGKP